MFSKFLSLEAPKQERILNTAIHEFAQKGYKNASTNEIVKNAAISKGLLFHYFKNKKDLYFFLFDYLMGILSEEYYQKLDLEETDFFKKMRMSALLKLELFKKHPQIFNFFLTAYAEEDFEVKKELEARNKELLAESFHKIYENVDFSKFKKGLDPQRTFNIIIWALEGYANQMMAQFKDIDEDGFAAIIEDLDVYLQLMQECFYQ